MVDETVVAAVDPFRYMPPQNGAESISFANANGYEWSYLDTCRENGVTPIRFPDGWQYAWLEYNRRATTYRIEIREAFRTWRSTGTLPGLSSPY